MVPPLTWEPDEKAGGGLLYEVGKCYGCWRTGHSDIYCRDDNGLYMYETAEGKLTKVSLRIAVAGWLMSGEELRLPRLGPRRDGGWRE
jgi:hypothetical protein